MCWPFCFAVLMADTGLFWYFIDRDQEELFVFVEPDHQEGWNVGDKEAVPWFCSWISVADFPEHSFGSVGVL